MQGLGVLGEVLGAVGGVEALGQDDDIGTLGGCFEDLCPCSCEIGGLVGTCGRYQSHVITRLLARLESCLAYQSIAERRQASEASSVVWPCLMYEK